MKIVLLLLVCVAASAYASEAGPLNQFVTQVEQHVELALQTFKVQLMALIQAHRPQFDNMLSTLSSFVSALPQLKDQLVQKVKDTLIQLTGHLLNNNVKSMVASSTLIAEAKILGQLQELAQHLQNLAGSVVNHFVNAVNDKENKPKSLSPAVQSIISELTDKLNNVVNNLVSQLLSATGKRDLSDMILNTLGLGAVWDEIKNLGNGFLEQLTTIGTLLFFQGTAVWNQAKPILAQLVSDLTAHTGNAVTIVNQAIAQLSGVITNGQGKRDLMDSLGLNAVWDQIKELGLGVIGQFAQIGAELLFAGKAKWAEVQKVFAQLVADLTAHTGSASSIVAAAIQQAQAVLNPNGKRDLLDTLGLNAVWDQIKELGTGVLAQFATIGAELLFAGKAKWAEVQKVFAQLVADLTAHTGSASSIVAAAIQQAQAVLQAQGKRNLLDTLGLNAVWDQIKEAGATAVGSLIAVGTEMLFAGKAKWDQAMVIFQQLVADLTAHTGSASSIVANAVQQVQAVLNGQGKRDLTDIISSQLGLGAVWSQIQV
jgi:cell division septum initiation protein DivIVA